MLYSNIFFLFFIVSEYRLYLIQRTSFQHEIHHFLGPLPVIGSVKSTTCFLFQNLIKTLILREICNKKSIDLPFLV